MEQLTLFVHCVVPVYLYEFWGITAFFVVLGDSNCTPVPWGVGNVLCKVFGAKILCWKLQAPSKCGAMRTLIAQGSFPVFCLCQHGRFFQVSCGLMLNIFYFSPSSCLILPWFSAASTCCLMGFAFFPLETLNLETTLIPLKSLIPKRLTRRVSGDRWMPKEWAREF